jgi:hypothetical protein
MGKTGLLSSRVKRPRHEANLSFPSSAEIKNAWSYTSIPPHVCMVWCIRNNLTLQIYL